MYIIILFVDKAHMQNSKTANDIDPVLKYFNK